MTDLGTTLSTLHRPQLLVRAARAGLMEYNRKRTLKRIMGDDRPRPPAETVDHLIALEAETDANRRAGSAAYSVVRHIELLVALMGEAKLIRA